MFRKGFVISFYHGNLWRSFDAANWALRHTSGDMTGIYMDDEETGATLWLRNEVRRLTDIALEVLTDEQREFLGRSKTALKDRDELRQLWNEGRQEFFVSKMMDIYDGIERPVGLGAVRVFDQIQSIEEQAYAKIRLSAVATNGELGVREDVLEGIKLFAIDNFMEPVPGVPWYCIFKRGSTEHAELANCLKARTMHQGPLAEAVASPSVQKPDYAFSGTYPCLSCGLCVILNDNQETLKETVAEMRDEVAMAATPALAESAQAIVDDVFNLLRQAEKAVEGKQRYH